MTKIKKERETGDTDKMLVTRTELADRLSVSTKTVQRLERAGVIPVVRVRPRSPRYDVLAVFETLQRLDEQGDPA